MLKNYLTVALRTLRRRRGYAFLNIAGLTFGLAGVTLIAAFLHHERSFDQHLPHAEDLYRLNSNYRASWYSTIGFEGFSRAEWDEQRQFSAELQVIPAVEQAATVYLETRERFVEASGEQFAEGAVLFAATGPAFLDLFGPAFLAGDPVTALDRPRTALLTEVTARRYFGDDSAIGQTIRRDSTEYEVTGVIAEPPATQHLRYDLVLHDRIPSWGAYTYLRLTPGTDPAAVVPLVTAAFYRTRPDRADDPLHAGERLQPVTSIHLAEPTLYEAEPPGDPRYLRLFAVIAALLLVVTCTNYMNLAAALYEGRGREIGVRKAMGAQRESVAGQFLAEGALTALVCFPLVLGLALATLPAFNTLMGVEISPLALVQPGFLPDLVGLVVATGLVGASYPALVLSGHRAAELFRGSVARRLGGVRLRQALVVAQFALLIGLAGTAVVIHQQVVFMAEKDLGFEREGVVALQGVPGVEAYQRLRAELERVPSVRAVGTGPLPGPGFNRITYRADTSDVVYDDANSTGADLGYFGALGIDAPALGAFGADGREQLFFINETAAERLGYANPVGRDVITEPEAENGVGRYGYPETIAGVLPDWHLFPLREEVRPLFVVVRREATWAASAVVRVETAALAETMDDLSTVWAEAVPDRPFAPTFVDESLASLYEQERRAGAFSAVLTGLAALVAVLGLIGLASFMAARRRKELGVRKVLGARTDQLVTLLTRELAVLVGVAFVVAVPAAWVLVERWLEGFAYRIEVSPVGFAAVGAVVLGVALVTVAGQAFRAATANPVQSLRHE
ncbi:MAG: FtsX-like permease family protein [Bacteroidota bacterium]